MAVVTLDSSVNGAAASAINDRHFLLEGRYLANTGDGFDFSTFGGSLVVNGQIDSGADGIDSNTSTRSINVTIGRSGSVVAQSDGMDVRGTSARIINNGSVTGIGNSGIEVTCTATAFVTNTGEVFGRSAGVTLAGDGSKTLVNSGLISSTSGVEISGLGTVAIANTGDISGTPGNVGGLSFGITAFSSGIDLVRVQNAGTISGMTAAYSSTAAQTEDIIDNSGTFLGNVILGGAADTYRASATGTIVGILDAGAGNDTVLGGDSADEFRGGDDADTLKGRGGDDTLDGGNGIDFLVGADGNDTLSGGGDNDRLFGGDGNDTLAGGNGNDSLEGGSGDDSLAGGNFADTLKGGSGDDTIHGDGGADRISAGAGDDLVEGGNGSETIWGGLGEDTIIGGLAADEMWGGGDADIFVWESATESTSSGPDRIRDFEEGLDRMDLSGVGSLEFVGSAGFTGGGQASVRYVRYGGQDRTEVRVDADGNGSLDMLVRLDGAMFLSESDFIL